MKKFAGILFLTCASLWAQAQDQLFKKDNTKVLVKILEVGPDEIRYKRYDNLNGPTYLENKSNVSLIIFENGQHQVIGATTQSVVPSTPSEKKSVIAPRMNAVDSTDYFRYPTTIGLNFLYFFNNELGFSIRHDFFNSNFNIIIPVGFGVSKPNVTQAFYLDRNNNGIDIENKVIEAGFGINYYPALNSNVNFFIGPCYRYTQYNVHQSVRTNSWPTFTIFENNTALVRHSFSITNGLVFRTKSRLSCTIFTSLGFKNDQLADPLRDSSGNALVTLQNPMGFYWWNGFEVGFSF